MNGVHETELQLMSFSHRHLDQGNEHLFQMIMQLDLVERAALFEEALKGNKQQRFRWANKHIIYFIQNMEINSHECESQQNQQYQKL